MNLQDYNHDCFDDLPMGEMDMSENWHCYNNVFYKGTDGRIYLLDWDDFAEIGNLYLLPENYDLQTNPWDQSPEMVCVGHVTGDNAFIYEPDNKPWT